MLALLAAQHPSRPRRCLLLTFLPEASSSPGAAPQLLPSTRIIRGAAASAILKESSCLVRTSMQAHQSRDAKNAPRMPPPTISAARHSGLPHPAAGPGPWAWEPAAGAGCSPRARRSPPPRRKAKGTHRGEEEEEARVAMSTEQSSGMEFCCAAAAA